MADLGRWFKLWVSVLNDPELMNLDIADFGRWAKLGVLVKEQGTDGTVVLFPPAKALCFQLGVKDFPTLIRAVQRLPHLTVSGETNATVTFSNWLKYQGDFSTERVRRYRQRETAKKRGEEIRREVPPKPPGPMSLSTLETANGHQPTDYTTSLEVIQAVEAGHITQDQGRERLRVLGKVK